MEGFKCVHHMEEMYFLFSHLFVVRSILLCNFGSENIRKDKNTCLIWSNPLTISFKIYSSFVLVSSTRMTIFRSIDCNCIEFSNSNIP